MSDQYAGFEPDPVYPDRYSPGSLYAPAVSTSGYSGMRCGCRPDLGDSCPRCDGRSQDEWAVSRGTPAERAAFHQQMAAFRAWMDGTPTDERSTA